MKVSFWSIQSTLIFLTLYWLFLRSDCNGLCFPLHSSSLKHLNCGVFKMGIKKHSRNNKFIIDILLNYKLCLSLLKQSLMSEFEQWRNKPILLSNVWSLKLQPSTHGRECKLFHKTALFCFLWKKNPCSRKNIKRIPSWSKSIYIKCNSEKQRHHSTLPWLHFTAILILTIPRKAQQNWI